MNEISTKPYLLRAIFEWCNDAGFTPYLSVKVDENVRVPMEYVKNGEIVLSIATLATRDLTIGNEWVQFSARFNGVSREISVPIYAVQAIFARENGRGYFFEAEPAPAPDLVAVPTTDAQSTASTSASPSSFAATPYLQAVPPIATDVPAVDHSKNGVSSTITTAADNVLTDQPDGIKTPENPDAAGAPDSPNSPKRPPRGNLRVIK